MESKIGDNRRGIAANCTDMLRRSTRGEESRGEVRRESSEYVGDRVGSGDAFGGECLRAATNRVSGCSAGASQDATEAHGLPKESPDFVIFMAFI